MVNGDLIKLEERPKFSSAFERGPTEERSDKEKQSQGNFGHGKKPEIDVSDYTQSVYTFNGKPTFAPLPGNTRRDVNYRGALNTTAKSILQQL